MNEKADMTIGNNSDKSCRILRVEKSSIYDGRGLRNVVFFKGCPMQCAWCSTPESQSFNAEIGIDLAKCINCGECAKACKKGALQLNGQPVLQRELCDGCFTCAEVCKKRAIKKYGLDVRTTQLASNLVKDEIFYFHSGGGVTLSGGEPCAQSESAAELLHELKKHGVHTSIETALCCSWENIKTLLPYLDCVLADIKHMDSDIHKRWTGFDNSTIIENIHQLDSSDYPFSFILRFPLIPDINDDDENLYALAALTRKLTKKLQSIEILPYHRLGSITYKYLGRDYRLEETSVSTVAHIEERVNYLRSCLPGVPVMA